MADGDGRGFESCTMQMCLALEEAIDRLESGANADDIVVDLGAGVIARADGPRGTEGLLQRLKALRLLQLLASKPDLDFPPGGETMRPDPRVKAMLDVIAKAR